MVVGVGLASIALAQNGPESRGAVQQMGLGELFDAVGQGCNTVLNQEDSRPLTEDQFDQLATNCGPQNGAPAAAAQ